jgi:hypothetical protein
MFISVPFEYIIRECQNMALLKSFLNAFGQFFIYCTYVYKPCPSKERMERWIEYHSEKRLAERVKKMHTASINRQGYRQTLADASEPHYKPAGKTASSA